LGVVRSLRRGRMPTFLVATTRWCPAAWNRSCRLVRLPSLDGRNLIDGLKALSGRLGQRPVLILTGDVEVETVSAFREEIEPLFHLSLPAKEMVSTLADKALFQKFAEREGFPVPRAVIVRDASELHLLKTLELPLVIKPSDKTLALMEKVERAVRADTLDAAWAAATCTLKRAASLVVQEWIDGADSDIYFTLFVCDANSKPTAVFTGRKVVCDPPLVGSTAVCVAAPEVADELARLSEQFIARAGYQGIGSLEFKLNRKNGKFIIVEPTVGRTDWQEEIATLCGTNIPLIAYWTELGQPIAQTPGERGPVAWRSSLVHRVPPGALPEGATIRDGYFRLADPLPGLYHYLIDYLIDALARQVHRLVKLINRSSGRSLTSMKRRFWIRFNRYRK
jgi:D-aspartate ligase